MARKTLGRSRCKSNRRRGARAPGGVNFWTDVTTAIAGAKAKCGLGENPGPAFAFAKLGAEEGLQWMDVASISWVRPAAELVPAVPGRMAAVVADGHSEMVQCDERVRVHSTRRRRRRCVRPYQRGRTGRSARPE